jgi:hypothetical protein
MNYQEFRTRIQGIKWYQDTPNWLVREISLSTEITTSQKIQLLEMNKEIRVSKDDVVSNTNLRQSLYNIIDMLNRGSEVVATQRKLADYKNLVRDRIVYIDVKTIIGIVNDPELGEIEIEKKTRYMKLTPLGSKFARELANKGKELANQEIKRLSRLRLI